MSAKTNSPINLISPPSLTDREERDSSSGFSRREFLKGTGVLVVGFSVSGIAEANSVGTGAATAGSGSAAALADIPIDQVDSYLAISKDAKVTIFTGRMDMGTGNRTCFMQFVADELDVAIERLSVIAGDTDLTPDGGKTTASDAIPIGGQPLKVSAAAARQKLLQLASTRLGVPVDQLTVNDGTVSLKTDATKKVTYWELIGDQRFSIRLTVDQVTQSGPLLRIPEGVTLKTPAQYKYVGKSIPRFDMPDRIIRGGFVQNIRIPDMLHGRVILPPTVGGKLVSVDESSVRNVPGFIKLVVKGDFVGVICQREEQAIAAMEKLKVTWSDWAGLPAYEDLFQAIRRQPPDNRPGIAADRSLANTGDVDVAMASAAKTIKVSYEIPIEAHAMFGPNCAVADVSADKATVWTGTQWPRKTQEDVALLLGFTDKQKVRIIWVEDSGSYGRLAAADTAGDAALLSQAVRRPVRVQWTRQQEFQWQPYSTPYVFDYRIGTNAQGGVVAIDVESWVTNSRDAAYGKLLAQVLTGTAPGNLEVSGTNAGTGGYTFTNVRSIAHLIQPLTRRGLYLRSPGGFQGAFAAESIMDELAASARVDPIDYRLRYLTDARALNLIQAVKKNSSWVTRSSPNANATSNAAVVTGRGFARSGNVATVVEVSVERQTGVVRVTHGWVTFECGLIVNPDGLLNQVQQATLQGYSRALHEEVKFNRSSITSVDWVTYPILRISEVPPLEVELLNRPDLASQGAGEPATTPTAAAIGNAIFDATGVRIRRLPFSPERVKAALAAR